MAKRAASTEQVRIDKELARRARIIAAARNMTLPEYVEGHLERIVAEEIKEVPGLLGLTPCPKADVPPEPKRRGK